MAYIRESTIEKHLVAEVKKAGGIAYKFLSPGRRSVPDRLVLLPGGRVVLVECKAPGEKPRPEQLREHERLVISAAPEYGLPLMLPSLVSLSAKALYPVHKVFRHSVRNGK